VESTLRTFASASANGGGQGVLTAEQLAYITLLAESDLDVLRTVLGVVPMSAGRRVRLLVLKAYSDKSLRTRLADAIGKVFPGSAVSELTKELSETFLELIAEEIAAVS